MEKYTVVPTEELENWQEAREQDWLNSKIRANRERKEQDHLAGQARIRELEQQRQERFAEITKLVWTAFFWVAGCAALVILAHTGAIAGWVMHVGTSVLNLMFGYMVGKTIR